MLPDTRRRPVVALLEEAWMEACNDAELDDRCKYIIYLIGEYVDDVKPGLVDRAEARFAPSSQCVADATSHVGGTLFPTESP